MKVIKQIICVLLIAASAIFIWETALNHVMPMHRHAYQLTRCTKIFHEYRDELNTSLPHLTALAGTTDEAQPIADSLYAYVQGESSDACLIDIPLKDIGDFYQHTYLYGLLWTEDIDRLLAKNPDIVLVSLEDGWCAYANTRPQ